MLGSKSSVLLLALFITLICLASSGVMVPREVPEDPPEAQEGPSGAAPQETSETNEDEEGISLLGRGRDMEGISFGNPPLGGNIPFPELEKGFEAMPPLKPDDFEIPFYPRPGIRTDYDNNRRNSAGGNGNGGRPFGGRWPNGGPRIPVNGVFPFGGKDNGEGRRIPTDDLGRDRPFRGRDEDERKGFDEDIDNEIDTKGDEDVDNEIDTKGDEDIDNEIDAKGNEDIDNEIDTNGEDEKDKGGDDDIGYDDKETGKDKGDDEDIGDDDKDTSAGDDTGNEDEKDAEEDFRSDEKPDEVDGKKPDIIEDKDEGSEEKDGDSSDDGDVAHPPPEDEDKGIDEIETGIDQDEKENADENTIDDSDNQPLSGGFMFDTPFFNIRQVTKYFQQLENALERVFRETVEEASSLNGTFANSTEEEEMDVNGNKYVVRKSIIKAGDNSSSIMIQAISSVPEYNDTKAKECKTAGMNQQDSQTIRIPEIEDTSRKEKVKID